MLMQHNMSDSQLRYFGTSLVAMLLIFAALFHWRWQIDVIAGLLAVIGATIGVVYYAMPTTQRSIYNGFRKLTYPIQLIASAVILAVVYYAVLAPIGSVSYTHLTLPTILLV